MVEMRYWPALVMLALGMLACGSGDALPRDRLAICVQLYVETVGSDALLAEVESALRVVEDRSPAWPPPPFPLEPSPVVERGCPAKPIRYTDPPFVGRLVDEPNFYAVFVYLVELDEVQRGPTPESWGLMEAEYVCEGDVCGTSTKAIYLSPADLADGNLLSRVLGMAVGVIDSEVSTISVAGF